MRRLNLRLAMLTGIAGTLFMASKAVQTPAGYEGSSARSKLERLSLWKHHSDPEIRGTAAAEEPTVSRGHVSSLRTMVRYPGVHFLFSHSADPFEFPTPLGT